MMKTRSIAFLGGSLAVVLSAAAFGWAALRTDSPALMADPDEGAQVAKGEAVYQAQCAACHGVDLEGQPDWRTRNADGRLPAPPHDETGHTWHHSDLQLFRITKHGLKPPVAPEGYESDMPAFDDVLSDDEIWAVLAFIKSRWPERERKRQSGISRRDAGAEQ